MAMDRQRFRKTYGKKRVKPRFVEFSTGSEHIVYLETHIAVFNNVSQVDVILSQEYIEPVILTSATDNVNTFVIGFQTVNTVTVVTVGASAAITGDVYVAVGEATNTPVRVQ